MDSVNENSTSYVTSVPRNEDKVNVVPATMSYRIDCLKNKQEILGDTAMTPALSVKVKIPPSLNYIIDQKNKKEIREVTVTAGFGADDQTVERFNYGVINLYAET